MFALMNEPASAIVSIRFQDLIEHYGREEVAKAIRYKNPTTIDLSGRVDGAGALLRHVINLKLTYPVAYSEMLPIIFATKAA